MGRWIDAHTDHGGVLWGILCCWLLVAANCALFAVHVPVGWVVPFDVFGVPALVTLGLWFVGRVRGDP